MICPYCGKENPENLDICDFCGGPLTVISEGSTQGENPLEPSYTVVETPSQSEALPPPHQFEPEVLPPLPPQVKPPAPRGLYGNRIWWVVGCAVLVLLFLCCSIGILTLYRIGSRFTADSVATLVPPIAINLAPTTAPTADPGVLFFDDFSDPSSGWDSVDTSDYYSNYYEGSYRMTVNTDMSDSWANPGSNVFGDVRVEVDATKNGGPDDNDFGVICRYQNANEFYYGVISSDGYYGILKVSSDSSTQLGYEELQPSSTINLGANTNQVRFDCVGDVLTLYVNGQQVDQQTDTTYTSGNVGLIAGTYDTPGTDILFDNFNVLQP